MRRSGFGRRGESPASRVRASGRRERTRRCGSLAAERRGSTPRRLRPLREPAAERRVVPRRDFGDVQIFREVLGRLLPDERPERSRGGAGELERGLRGGERGGGRPFASELSLVQRDTGEDSEPETLHRLERGPPNSVD